jgi:hypothetical protein
VSARNLCLISQFFLYHQNVHWEYSRQAAERNENNNSATGIKGLPTSQEGEGGSEGVKNGGATARPVGGMGLEWVSELSWYVLRAE